MRVKSQLHSKVGARTQMPQKNVMLNPKLRLAKSFIRELST